MTASAVHPAAASVLDFYFREMDASLPDFLEGFYLYGSLTMGDFRPGKSDIDFVAITSAAPSPRVYKRLAALHWWVKWRFPLTDLNGVYVDRQALPALTRLNDDFPCAHYGRFFRKSRFENNLVTWHQWKTQAIVLRGPDPAALPFSVEIGALQAEMYQNLNSYWMQWIARHRKGWKNVLLNLLPQKTEWGVLGVSRQWYTLETGGIASKTAAGQYCLNTFPARYRDILRTALAVRAGQPASVRNGGKRAAATLDYMDFVVQIFNERYERSQGDT